MKDLIMNLLDRAPKTNAYGVIPVLFHSDCNLVGEHGAVLVTNRKLGLKNASVSFFLKNYADAPPMTPKLFLELETAAESQGYILHELVSYDRIKPIKVVQQAEQMGGSASLFTGISREDTAVAFGRSQGQPEINRPYSLSGEQHAVERNIGSIHHAEASAEMGETLIRNAMRVPPQDRREVFDMHSLSGNFEHLQVPAFLRKQQAEHIADFSKEYPDFAWMFNADDVDRRYAGWDKQLRESFSSAVLLLANNLAGERSKWWQLQSELFALDKKYQMAHRSETAAVSQ